MGGLSGPPEFLILNQRPAENLRNTGVQEQILSCLMTASARERPLVRGCRFAIQHTTYVRRFFATITSPDISSFSKRAFAGYQRLTSKTELRALVEAGRQRLIARAKSREASRWPRVGRAGSIRRCRRCQFLEDAWAPSHGGRIAPARPPVPCARSEAAGCICGHRHAACVRGSALFRRHWLARPWRPRVHVPASSVCAFATLAM
jgi:hypothetical protein